MSENLSKNERFLAHARTLPFWLYIAFGAVVVTGGALAVRVVDISPMLAFLAGIGLSTVLDVPLDRVQEWAAERSGLDG
ncbi:hypothetical protein ACFQL1_15010 [Halomicroarcula sp. GCM10025709]|uniref:hypothetical protein n=1 Tax=Haloarcula TaxID=2237 RepID=UPI0024C316AA|nr:hypothetical protein [Halomicroarcula sp. YJ-61-S]